jgi:alcohol dehydrogenase class IV
MTEVAGPPVLSAAQLAASTTPGTALWAVDSVRNAVARAIPCRVLGDANDIASNVETLIAAGGGTLLDEAKFLRKTLYPGVRLIAIPTIWGSGAENSPVVVLNRGAGKEIHFDPSFLPDAVVYWPELLCSMPSWRARYACGDAWAHVIEAFLSPLASTATRRSAAALIGEMLELPLSLDSGWFRASARACALQAVSSVGLIHGIAHSIESALSAEYSPDTWGHSRLCSTFLLPVLSLNMDISTKPRDLCGEYSVDLDAVLRTARCLFEPHSYLQAVPKMIELWPRVLYDRCTRTNCGLVRANHLEFFLGFL